jgi:HPt (histidine-containing phosphotransfer) domain-containing protein
MNKMTKTHELRETHMPDHIDNENDRCTDILDRDSAVRRLGNNEEFYNRMLALFFEYSAEQLENIAEAVQTENANTLHFLAHKLQGSSASVGANRIRQRALELENIGVTADWRRATAILEQLRDEMNILREYCGEPTDQDSAAETE